MLSSFEQQIAGKAGKEIPESSRFGYLKNSFALLEAEDKVEV